MPAVVVVVGEVVVVVEASVVVVVEASVVVVVEASVVVGAVADRPLVLDDVGAALVGERVDEEIAAEAGRLAAAKVDPPSDLHASARYRRHLVGLLTERAVLAAGPIGTVVEQIQGARPKSDFEAMVKKLL